MSEAGLGYEILVGGDLSGLSKAIQEVEKDLGDLSKTATKEVEKVEAAAEKAAQGIGKLGPEAVAALSKAGISAERLDGAVLGVDGRVRDAKGRFIALGAEGGAALRKLTGEAEKAGDAVSDVGTQATTGLGRLRAGLAQLDGNLQGFQETHKRSIAAVGTVGLAAGGAFAGLAIEVGVATKAFGDFEAELNKVQAVADVSGADLSKMREQAMQLGADTKFSAKEAGDGMAELSSAGFKAKETMDAIPGTLDLAAAGMVKVGDAAELEAGTLRGFNLAASEAGHVADELAQTAAASAVGISDLQLSMKYVAPVASSAGQSLEEMSAALAIMGNNMIKGEQAGTTIRGALVRLVDPPKEAAETLSKLGLALTDTKGKMLPLSDIIAQLRDKTASMTEMQRSAALSAIFGTEALSGMMALVKASPDEYQAMLREMQNADGAAKRMADTMNKGVNASLEQAAGSIETVQILIGEQLAPAISGAAKGVQTLAGVFIDMDPATKLLITGLGAGALAFSGVTAMAGALGLALPLVEAGVVALGLSINTALPWVGALSLAVGGATAAAKLYADAAEEQRQAQEKANKETKDAAEAAVTHKTALEKLVAEHDKLATKAQRSKEEEGRLHEILGKIRDISPDLAAELDKVNTSHWGSVDAVIAYIAQLDGAIAKQRKVLEGQVAIAQLAYDKKRLDVDSDAKVQKRKRETTLGNERVASDLTSSNLPVPVALPKPSEFKEMIGEVDELAKSEEAKKLDAAKKTLVDFNKRAAGIDTTPKTDRGKHFGGGGKGKKTKKTGKKGPTPEQQLKNWQNGQLKAMENEYNRALVGAKDDDEEAQIKRTWIVDLELSGLDKLDAGQKKVIALAGDLKKYEERQAAEAKKNGEAADKALAKQLADQQKVRKGTEDTLKAQAKAEADLEKGQIEHDQAQEKLRISKLSGLEKERAQVQLTYQTEVDEAGLALDAARRDADSRKNITDDQRKALKDQAQAIHDTKVASAELGRDKGMEEAGKKWVQSIKEIGGALLDLASAPSWEKLTGFTADLFADPARVERWGSALGDIAGAMADSGGDALAFIDNLGKIGSKSDIMAMAVSAGVLAVQSLTGAFNAAAEAQEKLRKGAEETADAIRHAQAILDGPEAEARAKADDERKDLNDRLLAAMAERKAALKPIDTGNGYGEAKAKIAAMTLDDFPDLKNQQVKELAVIDKRLADTLASLNKATTEGADPFVDALKEGAKVAEDLTNQTERLKEVTDELNEGGRDSYGNRISLEMEKQLRIQNAMADLEEKKADALKREKQLSEDIAKINDDERRAIAAIENEGIAVRAKSETQDKAERIQTVKDEAQAKRDAKTDEINGIEDQMKKEEEATEKAVSNIRILADERIKQLTDERTQLELNTKELQKQLDIQRQMIAKASASAAPGGGTYSNSYNSSNTNFDNVVAKPGQTAWYTDSKGVVHYHDQGGTPVPPAGEGWATFKRGEFVLTPSQFNDMAEAAAGNARAMNDIFRRGALVSPSYAHMAQAASAGQTTNIYLGGVSVDGGFDLNNPRERRAMAAKLARDIDAELGGIARGRR